MRKIEAYSIYKRLSREEKGNWAKECGYATTKGLYRYLTYNEEEEVKGKIEKALRRVIDSGRILEVTNKVYESTGKEYIKRLKEKWENCEDLIKEDIEENGEILVRSIIRLREVDGKPVIVYPILDLKRRDTNRFKIAWQG